MLVVLVAVVTFEGRAVASSGSGDTVLRLTGQSTSFAMVDNVPSRSSSNVPKKGFGSGDYVVFSGTILRPGTTKLLGRSLGECIRHTTPTEKPTPG